ncbi:Ig-like domain-containing protein [Solwaraspora sp. WMMB335]|uniref:Ig-like domain-containing protein n=1 Tax=Solwaraspora sp. WMMB335 TaxID=3404118 RepID=UPI003B95DA21
MIRVGLRHRAACLVAAGVVVAATLLMPIGAQAAVGDGPGGLTLDPTSGGTGDDPIATATSANVCPTSHRTVATVGILTEESQPRLLALTGNFAPTDTPPSRVLDSGVGLEQNLVNANPGLGSGDYQIALVCFNDLYEYVVAANVWIHADLEADTWNVIEGGGEQPVTTTTSLAAQPTSAEAGQDVTLTATVTGEGAAGTVEFLDGSASLGSAALSSGAASKTVNTLAVGTHTLTARFQPADSAAFTPSTSAPVSVTITPSGGGQTGGQTLNITIPDGTGGGSLVMAVGTDPVTLRQVSSGALEFSGDLSPITVTDSRGDLAGWDVTGSTSDFTGGGNTIDGAALGWTPQVLTQNPASDVVAGSAVAPNGPGLKLAATLASAAAGKGAGASILGGTLDLLPPAQTPAGDYTATLTVTLMSK